MPHPLFVSRLGPKSKKAQLRAFLFLLFILKKAGLVKDLFPTVFGKRRNWLFLPTLNYIYLPDFVIKEYESIYLGSTLKFPYYWRQLRSNPDYFEIIEIREADPFAKTLKYIYVTRTISKYYDGRYSSSDFNEKYKLYIE